LIIGKSSGQIGWEQQFAYNNKVHIATKTLPFKANYGQDPKMEFKERRKRKYKAVEKFVERIRKI